MAKKTPPKSKKAKAASKRPPQQEALPSGPRRIQPRKYESFRLQKRLPRNGARITGSFRLFFRAIKFLFQNWKLFGGVLLVYVLLDLILVQGLSLISNGASLGNTKHILSGVSNSAEAAGSLFLLLLGNGSSSSTTSAGTTASSASAYEFVLLVLISLALIWTIRQRFAGVAVRVRDGFYNGFSQLAQFVVVLIYVGLQLIPAAVGIILYSAVSSNGIAASGLEKVLWAIMTIFLVLATCYMLSASLFALYIVTLNDMTPSEAMHSAGNLVRYRRLEVLKKIVFLPIAIFVLMGLLVLPFLLFAVKAAPAAFFLLTTIMIAVVHTYMFGLYRELLRE